MCDMLRSKEQFMYFVVLGISHLDGNFVVRTSTCGEGWQQKDLEKSTSKSIHPHRCDPSEQRQKRRKGGKPQEVDDANH